MLILQKEGLELWESYVAEPFDVVVVDGYSLAIDYEDFALEFRSRERAKKFLCLYWWMKSTKKALNPVYK